MGFMVNFGIGLGKSLDNSFQDKEAKRTEMVKYRMQTLEKEKEAWTANRAKAKELASQVNAAAAATGMSRNAIGSLLQNKLVSVEDIMKGKVSVIKDAHDQQQQTVNKPTQEQPATGASPFPGRKPEVPGQLPAESPPVGPSVEAPGGAIQGQVGQDQLQGGPQAPQMAQDPRAGMQQFPDGTQGPTMQTLQQQGTALPNQTVDGMTNQQHRLGGQDWVSHEGKVIASGPAQEQSMTGDILSKLRQGLFGRDIEGAGPEGDKMFMQANGMTPDDLRSMQNYSSPTYEMDEGSRVSFQEGEQFDPVKMLHAVKLEDIREGQGPKFYEAMKSKDWGTAMSLLYTTQEKQERMIGAARANAELSASAQRASGGQGQPSTLEKVNKYIQSLPPGEERDRAIRLATEAKTMDLTQRFDTLDAKPLAMNESEADRALAKLEMIERDKAEGGQGVGPAYESRLRKQAGLE